MASPFCWVFGEDREFGQEVEADSPANAAALFAACYCVESGRGAGICVLDPGDPEGKVQHFLATAVMALTYTAHPASPRTCAQCKRQFLHENDDSTEVLCHACD